MAETLAFEFADLVTGQRCFLVIPPGGSVSGEPKIGVAHPGCGSLADLSIELDAFYCPSCRRNGRISGAWAAGRIEVYR